MYAMIQKIKNDNENKLKKYYFTMSSNYVKRMFSQKLKLFKMWTLKWITLYFKSY